MELIIKNIIIHERPKLNNPRKLFSWIIENIHKKTPCITMILLKTGFGK
jgi:hypothetical protein